MLLDVMHTTRYRYAWPVSRSQHIVHLSPRPHPQQTVLSHALTITPCPILRDDTADSFGNLIVKFDIDIAHQDFVLDAKTRIATQSRPGVNLAATSPWDRADDPRGSFIDGGGLDLDVIQFRNASRLTEPTPEIAAYGRASFPQGRPVLEGANDLMLRLYRDFTFDPAATDVSTPVAKAFGQKRGVCQDYAHVALSCLRTLQIPARYVSGYLLTRPPPGQKKLQGADASHAWVAIWSPETGWVDFDPTNGVLVQEEHVAIAYGRDYNDVSPVSGVLTGGGSHTVSVSVDVADVGRVD
jgi:transglutaminase-like putative cysteine protease